MKDLKDAAAADGEAAPPAIQALPSATAAGDSTALHMVASIAGGEDAIRALVEAGEDVNCHNCRGETPLMFAACSDAVRVLLELGADREAADEAGRTALMHAAHEGYEEAVSELLAAGANAGACCRAGLNALAWAAGGSHARCVQLLAPATPADERWAAIEFAARAQSAPCLEALTACGMTAAEARRALLIAMHDRRLVSLGVSAEDAGKLAGEEAAPVPGSQAACIAVLAAAGADLNAPTPGTLPLMHAARARSVECVRALLQHGASPDAARPGDGATALHAAAGCADVVRELLAHGARSAVAVCEAAGGVTPLMTTASVRNVEAVQALLEAPDAAEALEMRGVSGKTALAMAVWSYRKHGDGDGAAAVVKALLGAGANVEAADNDGARPLHWAADSGFTEAARLLLAARADPAAAATQGFTPLALAEHFHQAEVAGVIRDALLMAHASATAEARAAGRPPPQLPAGVQGPVISCTVDVATGEASWLVQEGATTKAIAPPKPAVQKQAGCCCIQ